MQFFKLLICISFSNHKAQICKKKKKKNIQKIKIV